MTAKLKRVVELALVIIGFPVALAVLGFCHFMEWWHFGPSMKALDLARRTRRGLFEWRQSFGTREEQ